MEMDAVELSSWGGSESHARYHTLYRVYTKHLSIYVNGTSPGVKKGLPARMMRGEDIAGIHIYIFHYPSSKSFIFT